MLSTKRSSNNYLYTLSDQEPRVLIFTIYRPIKVKGDLDYYVIDLSKYTWAGLRVL